MSAAAFLTTTRHLAQMLCRLSLLLRLEQLWKAFGRDQSTTNKDPGVGDGNQPGVGSLYKTFTSHVTKQIFFNLSDR